MSFVEKQLEFVFTATTDKKNGDTRTLGVETFTRGIVSNERFDASNNAPAAIAPHLYIGGNGADSVRITVMHEDTARVVFADRHVEVMQRGVRMGEFVFDEYARNTPNGACIYRTISIIANGERHVLEETRGIYPGATVSPHYAPTARRVSLATTRTGALKPRKISYEETARKFARGMLSAYMAIAAAHGTDGTHFTMDTHVFNSATEERDTVHQNTARKKSMSGAARRKLRKLRRAANNN